MKKKIKKTQNCCKNSDFLILNSCWCKPKKNIFWLFHLEEFIINQCVIFIFKSYFSVSVLLQYILKLNLSASERFKSKIEKELSFCTNLSFQIPVTLNPVIFQTLLSWSNTIYSLKYLRSTTLFCKDIGVRKSEFATKTQFLYNKKHTTVFLEQKTCDSVLGTKKHTTEFLERKN